MPEDTTQTERVLNVLAFIGIRAEVNAHLYVSPDGAMEVRVAREVLDEEFAPTAPVMAAIEQRGVEVPALAGPNGNNNGGGDNGINGAIVPV